MKVAAWFTAGMLVLFLLSLAAGRQVFSPTAKDWGQVPGYAHTDPETAARMVDYKRMKLAFISFDLFNGLTRKDIEDIPERQALAFHALIAALLAVILLRHFKPRKLH